MGVALGHPAALITEIATVLVRPESATVTASVFGSGAGRRTAMFGGLALLAVSVFILGAWAESFEYGRCAIRFSSSMGCRSPSSALRSSRPFAADSAGRLTSYAGKIEIQCPKQTERTAVILIAGQSNAANNAAQRHKTRYPDRVLNFAGGRCYIAASPLLGSTGFAGEYWTLMADELIDTGAFDHVILSPVAVGASSIAQWAQGGALNATMIPLVQDLDAATGSHTFSGTRASRISP